MYGKYSITCLIGALLALSASGCALGPGPAIQSGGAPAAPALLEPGGEIDAMPLTTGAARVVSVWETCASAINSEGDCQVPAGRKIAIGPNTLVMAEAGSVANWGRQQWQLELDNSPIDLPAFGTYDFVRYQKSAYGQREVAYYYRAWDVAIEPAPGRHTLRAVVRFDPPAGSGSAKPGGVVRQWEVSFLSVSPNLTTRR